jgi:hypothetical protein
MIDRKALEEVAPQQFDAMASPSGVSLSLHLNTGEKYSANGFAEFHDTYCVVLVYPDEPLSAEDLGTVIPKNAKGELIFDRLLLPYHAIAYVAITAREPEHKSTIGFHR